MGIENKKILLVGGTSGIGFETARQAKQKGGIITIVGSDLSKTMTAAKELGTDQFASFDVANESEVRKGLSSFGTFDHIFVSAGGLVGAGAVLKTESSQLEMALQQRVMGAFYILKALLPKMTEGSFIFTSGLYADRPASGSSAVASSVGAIESMVKALALELAPIRINAISPGVIDTPLMRGFLGDAKQDVYANLAASLPSRRIGLPSDIAKTALFLMESGYINGETIHVDGGGRLI